MEKSEISRSTIFRNNYKHQKEAAEREIIESRTNNDKNKEHLNLSKTNERDEEER